MRSLVDACIKHKESITEEMLEEDNQSEEMNIFLQKKKKFHSRPPIQLLGMLEDYDRELKRISTLLIKASPSPSP